MQLAELWVYNLSSSKSDFTKHPHSAKNLSFIFQRILITPYNLISCDLGLWFVILQSAMKEWWKFIRKSSSGSIYIHTTPII